MPLHFVLVHGACHGAWCWYKLRCLLERSGHRVTALDLAGAGIDRSDPDSIHSMEEYDRPLLLLLSALPEGEKVVLVGHSAGGFSVTHAIHEFGDKIMVAVYVGAAMWRSGASDELPDLSEYGKVSDFNYGLGLDNPPTSIIIRKELQHALLYHLSPEEDATLASMLLRPVPIRALLDARFKNTDENVDTVKRVYIKTLRDQISKVEQQDQMIERWVPHLVLSVDSDHSPFFSAPNQLCDLLVQAAFVAGKREEILS